MQFQYLGKGMRKSSKFTRDGKPCTLKEMIVIADDIQYQLDRANLHVGRLAAANDDLNVEFVKADIERDSLKVRVKAVEHTLGKSAEIIDSKQASIDEILSANRDLNNSLMKENCEVDRLNAELQKSELAIEVLRLSNVEIQERDFQSRKKIEKLTQMLELLGGND